MVRRRCPGADKRLLYQSPGGGFEIFTCKESRCPSLSWLCSSVDTAETQGYHVQLTARADGDLTPEGIIQKVGDSSGSKYSAGAGAPSKPTAPQLPTASKPAFTPTRSGGVGHGPGIATRKPPMQEQSVDDDGWGADAPPVTRTQLEKVQPAYQPTKVNFQELKTAKPPSADPGSDRDDVVKGGYQPVGKVDIAAIRRQAHETGEVQDDRPVPVKGTYEPVGKVDIAAIRSRGQQGQRSDAAPADEPASPREADVPASTSERTISFNPAERLTSMPKPKVSNKFGGGSAFPGTKPPVPSEVASTSRPAAAQVGSASRTFADQGGKTPAQQWAERKAKERGAGDAGPSTAYPRPEPPIQSQDSGQGQWRSSYTGKQWAPVQTTHTGKSAPSDSEQLTPDATANGKPEPEPEPAQQSVSSIRDQLAQEPAKVLPPEVPTMTRPVPVPGMSEGPTEPDDGYEAEPQQAVPGPPQQPRSPTPSPPAREGSPIRVAMPVGRGVSDAHDEQQDPPPAMPAESIKQAVPDEQELEDNTDMARATAQATVGGGVQGGGIRALAQYDYEKAEDNEVDLREGEYVTEIEMIDQDWWVGVNTQGERGLFPSNYVEVVEDDNQPALDASTHEPGAPEPAAVPSPPPEPSAGAVSGPSARGLYDYEAAEDNEIGFPENAKITNIVSAFFVCFG